MISASQIREQLAMVLDGRLDLDNFEDWLVQSTWNIHQSGSTAAQALTFEIEESLSEFSSGHIAEQELRAELSRALAGETQSAHFSDVSTESYDVVTASPVAVLRYARP